MAANPSTHRCGDLGQIVRVDVESRSKILLQRGLALSIVEEGHF